MSPDAFATIQAGLFLGSGQSSAPERPPPPRAERLLTRVLPEQVSNSEIVRSSPSAFSSRQAVPKGTTSFDLLGLPNELVLKVAEQSDLSGRIILSQTSKFLQELLKKSCKTELKALSPLQRAEVYSEIGSILPEYTFCRGCRALRDEGPLLHDSPIEFLSHHCGNRDPLCDGDNLVTCPGYHLRFRHVQAAVKYTRLRRLQTFQGDKMIENRRFKLLRPYGATDTSPYKHTEIQIRVEPLISQARFILKVTFIFRSTHPSRSLEIHDVLWSRRGCCPHQKLTPYSTTASDLVDAVRNLIRAPWTLSKPSPVKLSCDHCPSDMMIELKEQNLHMTGWLDLGSGISFNDPHWTSRTNEQASLMAQQGLYRYRPKPHSFSYQHGSIQHSYEYTECMDRYQSRTAARYDTNEDMDDIEYDYASAACLRLRAWQWLS